MTRTANADRPIELLDAVVDYMTRRGVARLSLRPLAKAVSSSPRVLLYYFGTKEQLLVKALTRLRERQREAFARLRAGRVGSRTDARRAIWTEMSSPRSIPVFKLFFEAYALALRHPRQFADFLRGTVDDWLNFAAGSLREEGWPEDEARSMATVLLAGYRGFILDYCASGDRTRLDRAVDLWLGALERIGPPGQVPDEARPGRLRR